MTTRPSPVNKEGKVIQPGLEEIYYYETPYVDNFCWYLNENVARGQFMLVETGYYYTGLLHWWLVYWAKVTHRPPVIPPPHPKPVLDMIVGPIQTQPKYLKKPKPPLEIIAGPVQTQPKYKLKPKRSLDIIVGPVETKPQYKPRPKPILEMIVGPVSQRQP